MQRPEAANRVAAVAIHDVSPATWPECRQLLSMLDGAGARPLTLLVVPDYHHRAPVLADRAFQRAVEARLALGDEAVLHGMFHVDDEPPPRTLRGFIERRLLTRSEGEFAVLSTEAATWRIARGIAMFDALGWPLDGFVPPAWLIGDAARGALVRFQHRFSYMTVRRGLYHLPDWRFERTANLCYSPTNAVRRAYSVLAIGHEWRRAREVPLLRISLHPQDARVPAVLRHWERVIGATIAARRLLTKRDWALRFRERAEPWSPRQGAAPRCASATSGAQRERAIS
jgi:predicted deacetylase